MSLSKSMAAWLGKLLWLLRVLWPVVGLCAAGSTVGLLVVGRFPWVGRVAV